MQYNTEFELWQDHNSWVRRKEDAQCMAVVMKWAGYERRAALMQYCGDQLTFAIEPETEIKHLVGGNLCRDRLCPQCSWLRSRKVFGQVSRVMDAMPTGMAFIFATFTVKNCEGDKLSKELDALMYGWNKLTKRKELKPVKGWFRALEITYNNRTDTYHPHYHVIFAVNESYFKSRDYLRHSAWMSLWRDCCGLDYDPSVDVRRIRAAADGRIQNAVKEVAKYTVKLSALLKVDDLQKALEPVKTLAPAMSGRRLVAFGGLAKELHKKLDLDDPECGELTEARELRADVQYAMEVYRWRSGAWFIDEEYKGIAKKNSKGFVEIKEKPWEEE